MASVALGGLAAMPLPALAQDAPTQLDRVVTEGGAATAEESGTGPVEGYVARETGAGAKTATPLKEIPQAVSVIGREELADRGVVGKVDEALRYTAGVSTEPFGSDPDTDWFYIRGFDATQTGVFLDSLNLFSYGFGGFQIDTDMLERVEVLKGPASVLYGGSSPGGIVDLVRKRPQEDAAASVSTGINNFGNAFAVLDATGKLKDDGSLLYRFTGKIAGGDNYSDYSEDLRGFLMPQVTWAPDDATSVNVYAMISAFDQTHVGNGFLPYEGTVTDAPFGKIDRDFFFGEPDHDYGRYDQQIVGYEANHEFDSGWTLSQTLRFAHLDKREELVYPYAYTADYDLSRLGFKHHTKVDNFAVDTRVEKEFDTGALDHTFLGGVDYKNYKIDQTQASAFPATDLDPTNPVYGGALPAYFTYLDGVTRLNQIGVYAQDQIRFGGGWIATLNGRYDYVDIDNRSDLATGSYDFDDSALSGRAGLGYEFDNGVTPYVSVATFFNPLIGTSYLGGGLKPEEGHQIEGGVKYEPTFLDGSLTASVYQIVKQNVALTRPDFLQEQLGEVTSTGFELEGKVNLNQNWKLLATYTYNDLEITKDLNVALVGNRPYLIPEHQASLWLDYLVVDGPLEGLSVGSGLRYQGESYADNANTKKVPDAALVDAALRYKKNDWEASVTVANLFDKEYVKSCQGLFTCGYGEQRTITLKISKSW